MLKKIAVLLFAVAALFLIAGCSNTTSSTEEAKDLKDEIVGSWEAEKDNVQEIYTFNEDGTFDVSTATIDEKDGKTASQSKSSGTYSIEDDELTLETTATAGEPTNDAETPDNSVENETLNINGEPYVAKITIDGDTLTMDGGDTGTYTFTRVTDK